MQLALSIIIGNNRLNNSFRATTRTARTKAAAAATFDTDSKLDAQPTLVTPLGTGASAGAGAGSRPALRALGAGASAPPAASDDEDPTSGGDSFKQAIHDVFMHAFASHMLDLGVQVVDMSIEDVKVRCLRAAAEGAGASATIVAPRATQITNAELAKTMAQGAVARAGLQKAQIETEILRTNAIAEQAAEVTRAEGRARALDITTAAEATRLSTLADAEAGRIRKLDAALSAASAVSQQREMIRASGEIMRESKASLLLAHSATDVSSLLAGGGGAGGLVGSLLSAAGGR